MYASALMAVDTAGVNKKWEMPVLYRTRHRLACLLPPLYAREAPVWFQTPSSLRRVLANHLGHTGEGAHDGRAYPLTMVLPRSYGVLVRSFKLQCFTPTYVARGHLSRVRDVYT